MSVSSTSVADPPVGSGPGGLCRLAFRAPGASFDLAVPTDIQLVDLLPAITVYAGTELDEEALKHGGWVLQRLGEAPLANTGTVDSHGLHDGDVLYLRPFQETLPVVHFDDLVDGAMSSLRKRSDSWRPELTRRLLLSTMVLALVLGFGVLLVPGSAALRAGVAGGVAAILLAGALSASRGAGEAGIGTVLAAGAIGYLELIAAIVPSGDDRHAALFAGGMVAIGGAALGFAAVGASTAFFLGLGAAGALATVAGAFFSATPAHTAELTATVIVIVGAFVPGWAFWLSGLRLPPLPANAEQLQEGIDPHPSGVVETRSNYADGYLTALLAACGVAYATCLTVLTFTAAGKTDLILVGVFSILGVLHGRTLGGTWHRLAVVLPGLLGGALLIGRYALVTGEVQRMFLLLALLALVATLAVTARMVPGRRMIPHWARAGEMAHTLTAITLLPLLVMSLGIYHTVRGFGG